jgi:hypothetical protein
MDVFPQVRTVALVLYPARETSRCRPSHAVRRPSQRRRRHLLCSGVRVSCVPFSVAVASLCRRRIA